jgi:hypothetical protein
MPPHRISASADVMAAAEKVYAIIADYRHGHPQIVPRPPFGLLKMEQGGLVGLLERAVQRWTAADQIHLSN